MNYRTKQDLVDAAIALIPLFAMVLIMRPDIRRTIQMKASLFVKRVANEQSHLGESYAQAWGNVAAKAAQSYNNARI